jgi:tetratricopeptide (TPR) repeat protein
MRWFGLVLALGLAPALAVTPPAVFADDAQDVESAVVAGQVAPRLQTLGGHAHPITTKSQRAQLFFNQGLILAYGFNHREAMRAFQEVSRLDPDAPMGYWGQALVLGPNINAPMKPEDEARAHLLVQKARARAGNGSEQERAYVEALAARYSGDPEPDRGALDAAYAAAMAELHAAYPDDQDAATLYAESLMDLSPWDYWTRDYEPHERTKTILALLEGVRAVNPKHPGANHYYIHATEYARPDLGEPAADDLVDLAPGAGHLQHMPSHIYARVGRYADATRANEKAIAADEDYIVTCRAQGIYPLGYYPHNVHFYWWTTSLQGRSADSIGAARKVVEKTLASVDELPAFGQVFPATAHYALVRFGRWQEILAEPEPDARLLFPRGIHHYARGMALARLGRFDEANLELAALAKLQRSPDLRGSIVGANEADKLLGVASATLMGELAAEEGRYGDALASLHRAVLLQEALNYNEPPDWYYPTRQSLGAVLLEAGRAAEAESVYWQDLREKPENGWSLFGLAKALRAQGKHDQAAAIEARFEKAWAAADVKLEASRF